MRGSISMRLCLVARLPSLRILLRLIMVSSLRTLSLPMTFLLTKIALVKGNLCVSLLLIIRGRLRRNNQYIRIRSRTNSLL